jgi:hypothetical protein
VKTEPGFKTAHRKVIEAVGTYPVREQSEAYGSDFTGENEALSSENTRFWDENSKFAVTYLVRPDTLARAALVQISPVIENAGASFAVFCVPGLGN